MNADLLKPIACQMKANDLARIDFTKHLPVEIRKNLNHPVLLLAWLAELSPEVVQSYLSGENEGFAMQPDLS